MGMGGEISFHLISHISPSLYRVLDNHECGNTQQKSDKMLLRIPDLALPSAVLGQSRESVHSKDDG